LTAASSTEVNLSAVVLAVPTTQFIPDMSNTLAP
jgi:hypothetical protein